MTRQQRIEILELLREIARRTCLRCSRTYEVPISVVVDECAKEIEALSRPERGDK